MFSKMLVGLTAFTLGTGVALAGPDWAAIERARAERKAETTSQPAVAAASADSKVRALDHGPRAGFRTPTAEPAAPAVTSVASK